MATQIYRQRVDADGSGQRQIYEERVTDDRAATRGRSAGRYTGMGILYLLLDIVEVLLALRLVLRLLAANPGSPFVNFIYSLTNPLIAPFRGAFASTVTQGTVIEWSTILAMIIYGLIVYAIVRLVDLSTRPSATR
jgi:YggT family protein